MPKLKDPEKMQRWLKNNGISQDQYSKNKYGNPTDREIRAGYKFFLRDKKQNPDYYRRRK